MPTARLGAGASFYGKVGQSYFGEELVSGPQRNGINADVVKTEQRVPSGLAGIWVSEDGEKMITCTPRANGLVALRPDRKEKR